MDAPGDILEIIASVYGLLHLPGLGLPQHQQWSAQRGPGMQNICKVLTLSEVGEEKHMRKMHKRSSQSQTQDLCVTVVHCLTTRTSELGMKKGVQQYSLLYQNLLKNVIVKYVTLLK